MTTFVGWLKEQEGRENDPVGWFAQFWRDLDGKPRLSAPASITKHLEDRNLFQLTPGLTEAHDATLAEYRRQREGVVRAVASEAGVPVPDAQQAAERDQPRSPAGVIDAATRSAVAAAERATQLDRIEDMLKLVMRAMGLAITADRIASGSITYDSSGIPPWSWQELYDQAAVYATAHGHGWDEQEQA